MVGELKGSDFRGLDRIGFTNGDVGILGAIWRLLNRWR